MKAAIRQRALELGFDDCRFTTAAAPASAEQFQNWLAGKRHGEMAWLERTAPKRIDPQKVLPGAKSIICLATSYALGDECRVASDELWLPSDSRHPSPATRDSSFDSCHLSPVTCHGLIARYARFTDYHDVLGEQLKKLTAICESTRRRRNPLTLVCGHRAAVGARLRATRRTRLYRQTHERHQPAVGELDFPG